MGYTKTPAHKTETNLLFHSNNKTFPRIEESLADPFDFLKKKKKKQVDRSIEWIPPNSFYFVAVNEQTSVSNINPQTPCIKECQPKV